MKLFKYLYVFIRNFYLIFCLNFNINIQEKVASTVLELENKIEKLEQDIEILEGDAEKMKLYYVSEINSASVF